MSIKESALTAITAISNSDFVRAVTSAGASRRITVANLAKQIIEGYSGSSLAGSNQSAKSAIDSLNSKSIEGQRITSGGDLNDYNTPGFYYTGSSGETTALTNKPSDLTSAFSMMVMQKAGNNIQVVFDYSGKIYIRGKVSSGWQGWNKFTSTSAS